MSSKIRNLDTLEKEIYRLQLEARNYEDRLEKNFDYLKQHYASMTMNTIAGAAASAKEKVKEKIFDAIWQNEKVRSGIDKIVSYLADKAAEGIESLVDKILHRKE
jgi:hypothetical protein